MLLRNFVTTERLSLKTRVALVKPIQCIGQVEAWLNVFEIRPKSENRKGENPIRIFCKDSKVLLA